MSQSAAKDRDLRVLRAKQLASRGLLEVLAWFEAPAWQPPGGVITTELEEHGAGLPVTDKHASCDQDIVWV